MHLVANRSVVLFANGMGIARRAADDVVRIAREAAAARGVFTIALSGGSTPKVLYALLAEHPALRNSLPWDKMKVFFGDERTSGRVTLTAIFRWRRTQCSRKRRCNQNRFFASRANIRIRSKPRLSMKRRLLTSSA